MRVFLLGAGASKSYGQSPSGQRMPIARDFFQTFDKLEISANPWVLQEGLLGYLLHNGVRDPHAYLRTGVDIEALHSKIEEAREKAIRENRDFIDFMIENRAYVELIFIFASVINEIQNGPISNPHLSIARHLTPDDAVITFNWDTLMDRALAEGTAWRIDFGYGVTPRAIFSDGWRAPRQADGANAPKLLKLHGSTNWITAYPLVEGGQTVLTHDLDPGTLHIFESATEPYPCWAGRYMHGYQPFSYGYYPPNLLEVPGRAAPEGHMILSVRPKVPWRPEGTAPNDGLVSMPLIIPPVQNKTYDLFGSLFSTLWTSAEDLLAAADQIIIIGYSFPITDRQSNSLFTKAFMRRSSMPRIVIIDPAPERVAEKFRSEFGIADTHLLVLKEYFSGEFDLAAVL
ncbi:hypothetical protein [Rhizobium mulingense]|uniref:hypothetical protein n=1 Tax=Rhizobium mulingense TaxID=3031128 RepID=UPI002B46D437|nr:hypothetical protein [Rhizobium sp. MJ21]MEB3047685.1 hypothetical protein [Rhizobium sp. MJ21]